MTELRNKDAGTWQMGLRDAEIRGVLEDGVYVLWARRRWWEELCSTDSFVLALEAAYALRARPRLKMRLEGAPDGGTRIEGWLSFSPVWWALRLAGIAVVAAAWPLFHPGLWGILGLMTFVGIEVWEIQAGWGKLTRFVSMALETAGYEKGEVRRGPLLERRNP